MFDCACFSSDFNGAFPFCSERFACSLSFSLQSLVRQIDNNYKISVELHI